MAAPAAAAVVDVAHDMNGDFYVVGQQGEIEEDLAHRNVYVTQNVSTILGIGQSVAVAAGTTMTPDLATGLVRLNYWHLRSLPVALRPVEIDCRKIAFLRVHALLKGFGDVGNNPARYNVRYNDIKIVADNHTFNVGTATAPVNNGTGVAIPNYNDDADWRGKAKKKVMNMICLVAFFMRTRGHHYTDEMDARYKAIWRNCLYDEDEPGLSWNYIAHYAYHFIYPITLDSIWKQAIDERKCAGALIIRFNSAPAGVASVGAVSVGASDLCIIFPKVRNIIPEAFAELARCELAVNNHRWAGSINRRYYNGPELVVNEKKIGALAAVILGALQAVAGSAALRNSPALRRVAQNAPITGTLVVAMITKAAQDDRMVDNLFYEVEEVE
jgi:hypothetical protein